MKNLKFDGNLNVEGLAKIVDTKIKLRRLAKDLGKKEVEIYYDRQIAFYDRCIDLVAFNALITVPQLAENPEIVASMSMLGLPASSEGFRATLDKDTEETIIVQKVEKNGNTQVLRATINSPQVKKQVLEFKGAMKKVVESSRLHGYDLFRLDKRREKVIKDKLRDGEPLTDEDKELLHTKEIRETLCQLIHSGGRLEAVDYIKNWLFKWQNYSDIDAHLLIEALKKKYKISEPKTTPNITVKAVADIPVKQWMYLLHAEEKKDKKGNPIEELVGAFGLLNPELGIVNTESKVICTPADVRKYRLEIGRAHV